MAEVIIANAVIFAIVGSILVGMGIDLRKRSRWLFGIYAFISGFLVGFVRNDGAGGYEVVMNLATSLQVGAILAFVFMVGGATNRWHRSIGEKYEKLAERSFQERLENLAENLFKAESNNK